MNAEDLDEEHLHFEETDVAARGIARVYAEALLNAAEKDNEARETLDNLVTLVTQVFKAHPELETFFASGAVSRETKVAAIKTTFEGRADPRFVNFLLVLNDHDRLDVLRPILAEYRKEYERRTDRLRVIVESAVPLADDQRRQLIQQLKDIYKKEPVLVAKVDPGLLGGLVVRVGDYLFDGSVRNRLDTIRNQLIESSSHEIQGGRDRFSS